MSYEWGLAVDTGLPSIPGVAGSVIETLAIEILCELIDEILDLASTSSIEINHVTPSDISKEEVTPEGLPIAKIKAAVLAVLASRGCNFILEPFVGALTESAATMSFYDCHGPSGTFTTICVGTTGGEVTMPGEIDDGFPALPGAHLGIDQEYWND